MSNDDGFQKYSKAPIVEAVMQINFDTHIDYDIIKKFQNKLKSKYVTSEDNFINNVSLYPNGINVNPIKGIKLHDKEFLNHIIAMPHLFACSVTTPYSGWDKLFQEMKKNFIILKKITGYKRINRIAIKYINRIDVPSAKEAYFNLGFIKRYLSFNLSLNSFEEEDLNNFVYQIHLKTNKPDWLASITVAKADPQPVPNHKSIILDIDIFRINNIPMNENDLWEAMAETRVLKNVIFENCITGETRKIIK